MFLLNVFVCTQAQYILIHQALLEHNQFGETEITVSEIHSILSTLKIKNSEYEPTLMEEEFEVWQSTTSLFLIALKISKMLFSS